MPLDGTTISSIVHELSTTVVGGRIDKITQPEPDEIIIGIRAGGKNHKLLLTTNAAAPRINFTAVSKTSPLKAPMFCMVLRKHIASGRIIAIYQPKFERIIEICIEALDEMGDKSEKILLIEIMGKHSNIMLLDSNRKILDSIKHISPSVSSVRPILPNMIYSLPPSDKHNPFEMVTQGVFFASISPKNYKVQQGLYMHINGISPIMASEICLNANIDPSIFIKDLDINAQKKLYEAFQQVFSYVKSADYSTRIYWDSDGKAIDIAPFSMKFYENYSYEEYNSPSIMLETFYTKRDESYRINQKTVDMRKLVSTHQERCRKKSFLYERTLKEIENRDILRVRGELLTAYLYMVEKGSDTFVAENFYDNNQPLNITIDPTLTPQENAQRYFKQYNKQKRTFAALEEQIAVNNTDLAYLDSVAAAMETITDEADIAEIRAELASQGFAKRRTDGKSKKAMQAAKPMHYVSSDGFDIYVGKNNTQNDNLTLRMAKSHDIWMHTKDIPGSHVIIVTNGKELPHSTIQEGANLAAYNSRAKNSANVPVDYVAKKNVRKPNGAKPGFVIYDNHKTIHVTPVAP